MITLAVIEWFSAKTWRMTIIIFKWWWRKGSFPLLWPLYYIRALKVESIDAESKERQKVCVKEERARKLCRGQIMVFLDLQADEFGFFFPAEVRGTTEGLLAGMWCGILLQSRSLVFSRNSDSLQTYRGVSTLLFRYGFMWNWGPVRAIWICNTCFYQTQICIFCEFIYSTKMEILRWIS